MANLNTLQDMILDEEKLVTYASLSKELCIHVNESKMLLQQFVENIREKKLNVDLTVNYIVSGITNENSARTTVCTEPELEALQKDFNKVFYKHIYSVSKGCRRVDHASLLATNKLEDLILCTGIIKNNNCVKRTADEIGILKFNSQDILLHDEQNVNTTQRKTKKENDVGKTLKELRTEENKKVEPKPVEIKAVNYIKSENYSPKKNITSKQKVNIKQRGITGFFSKLNGNSSNKNVTEERKKEVKTFEDQSKIEVKLEKLAEDEMREVNDKQVNDKLTLDQKDNLIQKGLESNKTKNKNYKKNDYVGGKNSESPPVVKKNMKVDKKRKRIVVQSDSDSEHETNDNDPFVNEDETELQNESEDEIPPTPAHNTVKITSGIVNPRKRRKIVDKTYTTEDGYIKTMKEEVYESCSENEEMSKEKVVEEIKAKISPKEKKNDLKVTKKKISPKSGKQPTLMNFFKKSIN